LGGVRFFKLYHLDTHSHVLQTGNVVRKDPLTRRQVLTALEAMYDLVLKVEHLRREQPSQEEEEAAQHWYV
jgi:hypothetical protein